MEQTWYSIDDVLEMPSTTSEPTYQSGHGSVVRHSEITHNNFFIDTHANFRSLATPPSRTPDYISPSGSEYWFSAKGIIRMSDHWGWCNSCDWLLDSNSSNRIGIGYCRLCDFNNRRLFEAAKHRNVKRIKSALAAEAELWVQGQQIKGMRRTTYKKSGRIHEITEEVRFTVERTTEYYVFTNDGRTFGKATLSQMEIV